ncbi:MAG: PaaI family thioesterase [Methanomassiliicoccales archaeon]
MRELESFLPSEVCERLRKIMDVRYVIDLGIRTESISEDGEVVCTMDASDKINAMGGAHGGAVFTLADQAFALACNMGPEPQVALCISINYLKPGKGKLRAVARMVSQTRRTSLCEVKVFEDGELIATFQGTGYKLNGNSTSK